MLERYYKPSKPERYIERVFSLIHLIFQQYAPPHTPGNIHFLNSFEYTSGTPLKTPSGFMMGFYKMEKKNGYSFNVSIPTFSLDSPHALQKMRE